MADVNSALNNSVLAENENEPLEKCVLNLICEQLNLLSFSDIPVIQKNLK